MKKMRLDNIMKVGFVKEVKGNEQVKGKFYDRVCCLLSIKNVSLMTLALFIISLIPLCYLSFINRATGDDYANGVYTKMAWVETHSLIEVVKAIGSTVKQIYNGWQGTWFSIVMFSLQPEVFNDNAYFVVVFLMLFLWIGSTVLLFWQIGMRECKWNKWSYLMVLTVYLIISMQFIPSTKCAFFWFTGCMHYMLPFAMCQVVIWCLICFTKKYQIQYLIGIVFLMFLLGGSNYQAALFSLIVLVYIVIADFMKKKNKKIFLLSIPFLVEMIGLIVSMKAPGNGVRGGEGFGLSLERAMETIGRCFAEGFKMIGFYLHEKPIAFIGMAVLFLVILETSEGIVYERKVKSPIIIVVALFCLYCSMQAPQLYADVEVSGGVYNMNYLVFLLFALGSLGTLAIYIVEKVGLSQEKLHKNIVIPGLIFCLLLLVLCRSNLRKSTFWISMDYIQSGQAADYKAQMDLQTEILTDENVKDAVLPFINDYQGPLMSMPATADPNAWSNTVIKQFYGKDSVVAIPRKDWEEQWKGDKRYD